MPAVSSRPPRPRKVVFVTQQFDPSYEILATTVPQVTELARLVDEVVVIADGIDESSLPANCRAHSFRARTKVGRGFRFTFALLRELRGLRHGFVVAHMCSVYAVLAAPIVRPLRIPLVLWYVHWKPHVVVRAAARVATTVVTVDRASFPLETKKLHANGQAIDTAQLPCRKTRPENVPLQVRVVGRYSAAKGIETILRGFRMAVDGGLDARLDLHGPTPDATARSYRKHLESLVTELDLETRVRLNDALAHDQLSTLFASTDLLVNNARGGADKIVYEAAASCVPVLGSNPANFSLIPSEWRFKPEDPEDLGNRLAAFAALPMKQRRELERDLRANVIANHSIETWAKGLLAAAGF